MTDESRILECKLVDGRFVEPCTSLNEAADGDVPIGKRKGLFIWQYTNLKTNKPSRTFFGLKTGLFVDKGVALNFCPFCGVKIGTHFAKEKTDTSGSVVAETAL